MLRNQCPCYALLTYRTDGKANESRQVWNIASTIPYILFKKDACTFHLIKQIFSVAPPFIRRGQFSNKKSCWQWINPSLMWYMMYHRIFLIQTPPSAKIKSQNKIKQLKKIIIIYHTKKLWSYSFKITYDHLSKINETFRSKDIYDFPPLSLSVCM